MGVHCGCRKCIDKIFRGQGAAARVESKGGAVVFWGGYFRVSGVPLRIEKGQKEERTGTFILIDATPISD